MKWTIRIEFTPDDNPTITREIGSITRPMADLCPEQVGLTLVQNVSKHYLARSAFAADGTDLASVAFDPTIPRRTFHWARSSQGGRPRKFASCMPN